MSLQTFSAPPAGAAGPSSSLPNNVLPSAILLPPPSDASQQAQHLTDGLPKSVPIMTLSTYSLAATTNILVDTQPLTTAAPTTTTAPDPFIVLTGQTTYTGDASDLLLDSYPTTTPVANVTTNITSSAASWKASESHTTAAVSSKANATREEKGTSILMSINAGTHNSAALVAVGAAIMAFI